MGECSKLRSLSSEHASPKLILRKLKERASFGEFSIRVVVVIMRPRLGSYTHDPQTSRRSFLEIGLLLSAESHRLQNSRHVLLSWLALASFSWVDQHAGCLILFVSYSLSNGFSSSLRVKDLRCLWLPEQGFWLFVRWSGVEELSVMRRVGFFSAIFPSSVVMSTFCGAAVACGCPRFHGFGSST